MSINPRMGAFFPRSRFTRTPGEDFDDDLPPPMNVKPYIMVVEDNKTTQETLKRDLEQLGMELKQVYSAEEAWRSLESERLPHVLILDFHLPGEDGPGFFRRLAVDPRFKTIPVIPFTALLGASDASSVSTIASFLESRDTRDALAQPIVSKKGREDVYRVPPELILALGHALRHQSFALPQPMRDAMKKIISSISSALENPEGS